jgi:plasmid stability protein
MDIKDMKIRLPADLKQTLLDRANRNDRTINGEVLQILKAVLTPENTKAA